MEKPKHHNKEKISARNMAEITLKRVGKYEDLAAADANNGERLLREKTAELWKHFVVQGQATKDGILPFAGDLDAKGSVFLLTQAGILSQKKFEVYERTIETKLDIPHPRSEFKYRKNKGRTRKFAEEVISKSEKYEDLNSERLEGGIKKFNKKELEIRSTPGWSLDKDVKVITYVPAGQTLVGGIHFDTGNKDGVVVDEDGTAYFDHHGKDSDLTSSATKNLYKGLVREGMLKSDRGMEKMVEFITQIDNGTFPHAETYFPVFDQTIIGLQRFIKPETLYKFFQEGNNPKKVLSASEIKKLGLEEESKTQKKLQEATKEGFEKLKAEGFIVETKAGGKALININKNWSGDYLAAKYFKCDTYIIWSPEQQSFFISNNEKGLEFDLPQGVNVRGKMWIKPRNDGKPLEVSLKDILGRIAPPDFKPQGKLAEYLESEPVKSYNTKDMNPEGQMPVKKESADSKGKKPPTVEEVPSFAKPESPTEEMQAALATQDKPTEEAEIEAEKLWTPLDLPTEDQVKEAMAELEAKKSEEKEVIPEKTRINLARAAYLAAKFEFDKKTESLDGFRKSPDWQVNEGGEKYVAIDSGAKDVFDRYNLAKTEYFGARGEEMEKKLAELEDELKSSGLSPEEYAKEMKKASSTYLISEFKHLYDAQTDLMSAQNQAESPTILKMLYNSVDWYRKLPIQNKLAVSGLLLTGGVAAGATGGTIGAALAAAVTGGRIFQNILSSAGFSVAIEAGLKKIQKGEFESAKDVKFGEAVGKALEGASGTKKEELLAFLRAKDKDIESIGSAAEKDVRGVEKSLERRRWAEAGVVGAFLGTGLAADALSIVGKGLGYISEASGLSKFFGEKAAVVVPQTPEQVEQTLAVVAKEANQTVTIEKGGSVSQAAHTLVKEGKLSMEQFRQAWDNSFVDVNGVKVPIKDVSLVHAGDQVVYVPADGGAGHFEVVDYAKDKVGIGTNQDLYKLYEAPGKEAPVWLQKAVIEDVETAFKDNNLDANDARVLEFHHAHGSLNDQMNIEERLMEKMALPETQGKPFSDLFVKLSGSPEHAQALRVFENHLSSIGFSGADSKEFEAIKNVKVGDLLEKRGGSWLKDYFFASELTDKNGEKVSKIGIGLQRKLAEYVRSLVSSQDKQMTVEQFLQKLS